MKVKVLVVEDDPEIADTIKLCIAMRWPDSEVLIDPQGDKAAPIIKSEKPDIVLMELKLNILQGIREFSDVPIIIVSIKSDDVTKVNALELGADDYIVKPFLYTELLARMKAVMRHGGGKISQNGRVVIGGPSLAVDLGGRRVTMNGKDIDLTPHEWMLISYMARRASAIISHDLLGSNVWDPNNFPSRSAIKMAIRGLRMKLGDNTRQPRIIRSHRGRGYSLTLPES